QLLFWSVHLAGNYLRVNGTYLARLPVPRSEAASPAARARAAHIARLACGIGDLSSGADGAGAAPADCEELESLVAERFELTPADRRHVEEVLSAWGGESSAVL